MRIARVTDPAEVLRAPEGLFDEAVQSDATQRFLASPDHHLFVAYDDSDNLLGMVSGVELTHPDKGTEMFLYELSVLAAARRQGVGAALVRALADLAQSRGCYGMWVGTEPDNVAAIATYRTAGGAEPEPFVLLNWDFSG